MKTLYLDCGMGAAGDMLTAALLELIDDKAAFLHRLNHIGIPGVTTTASPSVKCGITGTHISVKIHGREEGAHHAHDHDHEHEHGHSHEPHEHANHSHSSDPEHSHNSMEHIGHLISHLPISDSVKENAFAIYNLIAGAESKAHGVPVSQVHFHEVGELDAVADIVGFCWLMEELAPEVVIASPVHVGSGYVRCSHGILPVPAPATAHILQGVPIYSDNITKGELCTPTGAAILKHFVQEYRQMPVMVVNKTGYGMGTKDFEKANCVRAFLGESPAEAPDGKVIELICNLDDMTPEAVAFAQQLLLDEGALDVYVTPILMKKNRAGVMLSCMCHEDLKEQMTTLIFKHTTTLGIRESTYRRYVLHREHREMDTKYGKVRVKSASGYGVERMKPEYDDIAAIAKEKGLSMQDVLQRLLPT